MYKSTHPSRAQELSLDDLSNVSGGYTPNPDDPNSNPYGPWPLPFPWPMVQINPVFDFVRPQLLLPAVQKVRFHR